MPNGSVIKTFMPRLHKSNALAVREEAADMIAYLTNNMIAMAASSGGSSEQGPWHEYVAREVPQLLEEYGDNIVKLRLAGEIIADPKSCDDDLEETPDTVGEYITHLRLKVRLLHTAAIRCLQRFGGDKDREAEAEAMRGWLWAIRQAENNETQFKETMAGYQSHLAPYTYNILPKFKYPREREAKDET